MPLGLNELLVEINSVLGTLPYSSITEFYELAYLQDKDDKTFPLVRTNQTNGIQISPNDKKFRFYHRLISQEEESNTTQSKGNDTIYYTIYNLRLVGIGLRRFLSSANFEDNADLALAVKKKLIQNPVFSDTSKLTPLSSNTDKISIFNEEWNGYELGHLSLELTAFTIDYQIKQRFICG